MFNRLHASHAFLTRYFQVTMDLSGCYPFVSLTMFGDFISLSTVVKTENNEVHTKELNNAFIQQGIRLIKLNVCMLSHVQLFVTP